MKKPTIFISSTIFDFRDLRGAIKYELERQGANVLASEFNDFKKQLDLHSYEACLKAIEQSDYFVLLIGGRVGGWFDEPNRISITQQEYKRAYELQQKGQIKIVTFVRSEVWNARESLRALQRHLQELSISQELQSDIMRFQSRAAADAEFIIKFIAEVGRNKQTLEATRGSGALPTGNWIHVFDDFRDVMDVLGNLIFGGLAAEEAATKKLLEYELKAILRNILRKDGHTVVIPKSILRNFLDSVPNQGEVSIGTAIRVNASTWDRLCAIMVHLAGLRINTAVLDSILAAPALLDFDPESGSFSETESFSLLARLLDEVRAFNSSNSSDVLSIMFAELPSHRPHSTTELNFDASRVVNFLFLAFRWANIVEISTALLNLLSGRPFSMPSLLPLSPILDLKIERRYQLLNSADLNLYLSTNGFESGQKGD